MGKVPVIGLDNPAPKESGDWWAETAYGIPVTSPCGEVTREARLSAPSEVVFQLSDTSECDGCVAKITARKPKQGVDVQFEIGQANYRGKCPYIGTERFRP